MKINEILALYKKEAKNGVIDLGWENGWNDDRYDLMRALSKHEVRGTHERSGSPSWKTTTFVVSDGEEEFKVTYATDSGD